MNGSGDTNPTPDVVERAKAVLEEISDEPWVAANNGESCGILTIGAVVAHDLQAEDACFIAAARSLVPELVAELEIAQKQVKALIDIVEHTGNDGKVPWSYIVAAWNALDQPLSGLS